VISRKFAWHILLLKRHADDPPNWAGPDCAALDGLRGIDMGAL
jgi:hypothetical protein